MAASAPLIQSVPRGTGMPAGVKTSDFAACSSKFIQQLMAFAIVMAGLIAACRVYPTCGSF
jgi:hypothetical protein